MSKDYIKPLGVLIDRTVYNIHNIASVTDITNKVTNMRYISISFIQPINGSNGINIKYNVKYWNALMKAFEIVSTGIDKVLE